MSRLGKKAIIIPEGVEVKIDGDNFSVKGVLGELKKKFRTDIISLSVHDKEISLVPQKNTKEATMLWGTYSSHVRNMISGVTKEFEKKLIITGVGYRAQVEGKDLVLNLGLSHPVKLEIKDGLKVSVDKNVIFVSGADKEQVGQFSAVIRDQKKPEPYKGKGIKYETEVIRRKAGKKAVAAG